MRKSPFKKALCILLMLIFASTCFVTSAAKADKLSSTQLSAGPPNGWASKSSRIHRGSKNFTYFFDNETVKNQLSPYVNAAKSLWGSSVSLTENSSSAGSNLRIYTCNNSKYGFTAASRVLPESGSNIHVTAAEILVNLYQFNKSASGLSNAQLEARKSRTIAHEIGHIYGLADLYSSGSKENIMYGYASHTKTVTAMDKKGMSVVTNVHATHSFSSWSFENTTYHKRTCSVCDGISRQRHISLTGNLTCRIYGYSGPITASLLE